MRRPSICRADPADAHLLESSDLTTMEAALTGESLPVSKTADPLSADTPLPERSNMVYQGTAVATGTARAVVVTTGVRTELGRIGELAASVRHERTPLERRLDALGHRLVWLALGMGAIVSALAALRGLTVGQMIETGIALAIAAVPEGLPAVATTAANHLVTERVDAKFSATLPIFPLHRTMFQLVPRLCPVPWLVPSLRWNPEARHVATLTQEGPRHDCRRHLQP